MTEAAAPARPLDGLRVIESAAHMRLAANVLHKAALAAGPAATD